MPTDGQMIVLVTGLQGAGKSTLAEACADALDAPLFAWDWCVAALTPFEAMQRAMQSLDLAQYRALGWAMVFQAARAQVRRGMSAVLDGMAREGEIHATRELARELGVPSLVVLTTCDDDTVARSRIEGRSREIPGWHELTWEQVERTRRAWTPPTDVDVTLDSTRPMTESIDAVRRAVARAATA